MGGWVDSHCHLFLLEEPPGPVLDRAEEVDWVLCPGVDLETSLQARRMATADPARIRWSAGLHPHEASRWEEVAGRIATLAREAAAVGECGLDYYRDRSPREDQRRAFRGQVALAGELGVPLVVHCRDAFADVYEILAAAELGDRAVLHSWTGGPRWTRRFRELGVTFSFSGILTYGGAETVRLAAAEVPLDRALVETDSPYLTPEPHRDRPNEPARVSLVGEALAAAWDLPVDRVAEATARRAAALFGR